MIKRKINKNHKMTDSKKNVFLKVAQDVGAFIGVLAIINLGFQCVWYIKTAPGLRVKSLLLTFKKETRVEKRGTTPY
jgi:hypothetical protein